MRAIRDLALGFLLRLQGGEALAHAEPLDVDVESLILLAPEIKAPPPSLHGRGAPCSALKTAPADVVGESRARRSRCLGLRRGDDACVPV